jgi:hypothetical protein
MHYGAVILLLPRLAGENSGRRSWPWRRRGVVLGSVAAAVLAVFFFVDYGLARQLYGLAALVHSWVEIPVLLVALGGIAGAQYAKA